MSKTVVIVDDSTYQRKSIATILENNGFTILGEAKDGQQTIDMVLDEEPDFVTMDNIMPGINGIDASEAIKNEGSKAKILMVSSVAQEEAVKDALSRGVDGFLKKPFEDVDLVEAIYDL